MKDTANFGRWSGSHVTFLSGLPAKADWLGVKFSGGSEGGAGGPRRFRRGGERGRPRDARRRRGGASGVGKKNTEDSIKNGGVSD